MHKILIICLCFCLFKFINIPFDKTTATVNTYIKTFFLINSFLSPYNLPPVLRYYFKRIKCFIVPVNTVRQIFIRQQTIIIYFFYHVFKFLFCKSGFCVHCKHFMYLCSAGYIFSQPVA